MRKRSRSASLHEEGAGGFVRGALRRDERVLARWRMPIWYMLVLAALSVPVTAGFVLLRADTSLWTGVVAYLITMPLLWLTARRTLLVLTPDHLVVRTWFSERLARGDLESVSMGKTGIVLRSRAGQVRESYVVLPRLYLPAILRRGRRIIGEITDWAGLR